MFRSTAESNYLSTFLSDEDTPLAVSQELVYVGHQIGTSSFFSTCFPNPPQPIRQVRFKNNFSKTSSVFWHSRPDRNFVLRSEFGERLSYVPEASNVTDCQIILHE